MPAFDFSKINYRKRLHGALGGEANFIATKLRSLPREKLKDIYDGLRAEAGGPAFGKALNLIIEPLVKPDAAELTEFINEIFESPRLFNLYAITDLENKTPLFAAYFFDHLQPEGNGFKIGMIQNLAVEDAEFTVRYEPADAVAA